MTNGDHTPPKKDIVESLREGIDIEPDDRPRAEKLMEEAADEIELRRNEIGAYVLECADLRAEIRRLREESAIHAGNTLAAIDDYNEALAEIERLREALEHYANMEQCGNPPTWRGTPYLARATLQKDKG